MTIAVAALIPAFCCETTIGAVVQGVLRHVPTVLVVDDGSTDATAVVARRAGAHVLRLDQNQGKGSAVRQGLPWVLAGPWSHVLMLDGDGQHDPDDIPKFLALAGEHDLVVGNRLYEPQAIPKKRFWTNYIGTKALTLMTGFPLEDSQCGFRLVRSSVLRRMHLIGRRYSVDTEILVRAGRMRVSFAHVPIRVIYNGQKSHFRPLADTVHIVFSAVPFKVDERVARFDPGPAPFRRLADQLPVEPPWEESGAKPEA
ncbi:MAG: glycosyltransferase family 2 protein [Thermoanaerobaculum sp.]|nr:glycosyltransferase family 2 protein [Thermoanaerobaculum sp.]